MKIGIIGAGHIGGGIARQLGAAGHEIKLSFSRDQGALEQLAGEIGPAASAGPPREAVEFGDVVVISVPWNVLPEALSQAGSLAGKVVIDTTNQFGAPPLQAAAARRRRDGGAFQRLADSRRSLHQVVQHPHVRVPGQGRSPAGRRARRPVAVRRRSRRQEDRRRPHRGRRLRACRPRRHGGLRGAGNAAPGWRRLRRGIPRRRRRRSCRGSSRRPPDPAGSGVLTGRIPPAPAY